MRRSGPAEVGRSLWPIVAAYAGVAALWLLLSETLLPALVPVVDARRGLGTIFLVSTAGLLTILLTWQATRLSAQTLALREAAIDREVESRAALASSLGRLGPGTSPEASAAAICDELIQLPDIRVAEVIAFGRRGEAVRLALRTERGGSAVSPPPIPASRANDLRERATHGPWLDEAAARRDDASFGPEFGASAVRTVGYWPLRAAGDPLAVLAVGTSAWMEPEMFSRRLLAVSEIGAIASAFLVPSLDAQRREATLRSEIEAIVAEHALSPVFQPVVDLASRDVAGYEALTRFADGRLPEQRFDEAARVGLGIELEEACLEAAVSAARALPKSAWVSFNVSPQFLAAFNPLDRLLRGCKRPVVIEMTEHVSVDDYGELRESASRLKGNVRLAVDDAGAGFASLRHILELRPYYVKLDMHLVRDIEGDPARQAMIAGMRHFANEIRSTLIAEGIETEPELETLKMLEVPLGQGFLLGRPAPAS